ncbi:MAG: hypothetical protein WDA65_05680 [Christensenellales bacterium]
MAGELYFSLEKISYTDKRRFKLSQVCSVLGADTAPLESEFIEFTGEAHTITAFEAAKKLTALYPGYTVNSLGPDECGVYLRHKKQSVLKKTLKTALLSIITFFGGAVALMTFHEDVNMKNVHESIYAFFNGGARVDSLIVSIPYSIGVALGFVVLLGLLSKRKKRSSVLDIDIYEYETSLRDFLAAKSKHPDE